jgi:hypothetical protein
MQNERDGRNDFDFFIGRWKGHNRRLLERLQGCTDWEEFEGTVVDWKILGGMGNMDEVTFRRATGKAAGLSIALFDPKSQEWNIYSASDAGGMLDAPLVGKFKAGRGEFYAQEIFENQHIFTRVTWCDITETSCRWEQAFSPDGGKTWETNWVADLSRLE